MLESTDNPSYCQEEIQNNHMWLMRLRAGMNLLVACVCRTHLQVPHTRCFAWAWRAQMSKFFYQGAFCLVKEIHTHTHNYT